MAIEGVDYYVRIVPFPRGASCGGMVLLNEDGTYSVYLNAANGYTQMKRALRHELLHIARGDLYNSQPIEEIENV